MKRIYYKLIKPSVFKRAKSLKAISNVKQERVKTVIEYLKKWHDIPISLLLDRCCETLDLNNNEAARNFIYGLRFGEVDIEKEARKLPYRKI